jgi:hypothetical protein
VVGQLVVGQLMVRLVLVRLVLVRQQLVGEFVVGVGLDLMLMEAHRAPTWGGFVGRFDRVHPSLRVMLFATGLLAIGSGFLMLTPSATVEPARAWHVPFLGLALAFGLAEASALHVEIARSPTRCR